jgi:hypothetical protein
MITDTKFHQLCINAKAGSLMHLEKFQYLQSEQHSSSFRTSNYYQFSIMLMLIISTLVLSR